MQKIKIACTSGITLPLEEISIYPSKLKKHSQLEIEIVAEYGLVMKVRKLKEFFASSNVSQDLKDLFNKCVEYMPSAWLSAFFAIPYPKISDEILFVVKKKNCNKFLLLN